GSLLRVCSYGCRGSRAALAPTVSWVAGGPRLHGSVAASPARAPHSHRRGRRLQPALYETRRDQQQHPQRQKDAVRRTHAFDQTARQRSRRGTAKTAEIIEPRGGGPLVLEKVDQQGGLHRQADAQQYAEQRE